jgi:survival-of-motor-neuron-related-splicing factor 30
MDRYPATVKAVSVSGNFIVAYNKYESHEEVPIESIKYQTDALSNTDAYKGMSAPKSRRVGEETIIDELPKWLEVKPTGKTPLFSLLGSQ